MTNRTKRWIYTWIVGGSYGAACMVGLSQFEKHPFLSVILTAPAAWTVGEAVNKWARARFPPEA